jgi:hypothetical protein
MPTPVTPTGWSAASSLLFMGSGTQHVTTPVVTTSALVSFIRRNAANNGYELGVIGTSSGSRGYKITLTYKAQ